MYNQNVSKADEREAMQILRDRGVATVVIHFSGGNDEGGADGADFKDAKGNPVEVPDSNAYPHQDWLGQGKGYGPKKWVIHEYSGNPGEVRKFTQRDATDDEVKWAKVRDVIEAPIYDRYGSFAGEFEVYGTVTWDVAKGTHEMHGEESEQSWSSF